MYERERESEREREQAEERVTVESLEGYADKHKSRSVA